MRSFARRVLGLTVGSAMLAGTLAPAPAQAQILDDDGGLDIEEILVGVAVLAGVVAVASEIFKDSAADWGFDRDKEGDRSAAVDECTRTAEREAERYGRNVRVRNVETDRDGSEYKVKGEVEVERDGSRIERAKFSCTARAGRVTAFRFTEGFEYAYRS